VINGTIRTDELDSLESYISSKRRVHEPETIWLSPFQLIKRQ